MQLRQQLPRGTVIARHRHADAYAAVVLQGGYREAGDGGRWHAAPGDVLIHLPFASHMNHVSSSRTTVLNLPLPMHIVEAAPHQRAHDPDLLARVAERDPREAAALLFEQLRPGRAADDEPVDALAADLASRDARPLHEWSDAAGVRRETVFRWFQCAYGVSPTQYRVEARARRAWHAIVAGTQSLAAIAAENGFADQAHLSRAVRALTGKPPSHWRMQHSFKTRPR